MDEDKPRCGRRCNNPEPGRNHAVMCVPRCYDNTARDLWNLPDLYRDCRQKLTPGQGSGDKVSGSRERPLGIRVDPHDLMVNMLDVITEWVRYVVDERGLAGPIVRQRAPGMDLDTLRFHTRARWLSVQHDWLAGSVLSIPYGEEIRDLHHTAMLLCDLYPARPEVKVGVPCRNPNCGALGIYIRPGSDRVECPACPQLMTFDEYREWTVRYAAYAKGQTA